jgi:hypothetical protein
VLSVVEENRQLGAHTGDLLDRYTRVHPLHDQRVRIIGLAEN